MLMQATPWAVMCEKCGIVFYSADQYNAELEKPNDIWSCPKCGISGIWVNEVHDGAMVDGCGFCKKTWAAGGFYYDTEKKVVYCNPQCARCATGLCTIGSCSEEASFAAFLMVGEERYLIAIQCCEYHVPDKEMIAKMQGKVYEWVRSQNLITAERKECKLIFERKEE